jgi:glycine dehydrogenase subunit 1
MATYIPHTDAELQEMLKVIGVTSIDELFSDIPTKLRLNRKLELPDGMSEMEMSNRFKELSSMNATTDKNLCFLGGGAYDHIIPAAIDHLLLRGDFFTAYTPYQPEVSQGTLQAIYEYQSLICSLTGMDQTNASLYEGATANVEAIKMAEAQTRRKKVVILETVNPRYRNVIKTINGAQNTEIVTIPTEDGATDLAALKAKLDSETAAVLVQYPNYFGSIEDIETIAAAAHEAGALCIVSANPIALAMLEAPGNLGADIVTGDGQPLGIPLSFGGPYVGFLAAKKALLRRMSGRIVGRAKDVDGKQGYVLTLQAREQHIRREKASSNICSNQALMALTTTIYMSLMGSEGLKEVAMQCFQKAHYMKSELGKIAGVALPFTASFFHEFVVKVPNANKLLNNMQEQGFLGGILLEKYYPEMKDCILVAVTEKRTKCEIDRFCSLVKEAVK